MKIKERFRLGKLRKAKEGHIIVTSPLYGYTFVPKKGKPGDIDFQHGYYLINEEEAKIVKQIFSWVANDAMTIKGVVKKLQDLGIPPRKSKRGVWNTSTLSSILKNRTYIGTAHYGASFAVVPERPINVRRYKKNRKTSRRMKPQSEWINIPTPKIIEEAVFDKVAQQIKYNRRSAPKNAKCPYLLSGKLWCTCGRRLSGSGNTNTNQRYYRCTNRILSFPLPPTCSEKAINAIVCDNVIWEAISKLMSSPELLMSQLKGWLEEEKKVIQFDAPNIDTLEKELVKLKAQEVRFNHAYGNGLFTLETLAQYLTPIRDKIGLLEKEIAKQDETKLPTTSDLTEEEVVAFANTSLEVLKNLSFDEKKAIITNTIERIEKSKEQLVIKGYIPISETNVAFCTSNRDSQCTIQQLPFERKPNSNKIPFRLVISLPPPRISYSLARKLAHELRQTTVITKMTNQ